MSKQDAIHCESNRHLIGDLNQHRRRASSCSSDLATHQAHIMPPAIGYELIGAGVAAQGRSSFPLTPAP
jgi:hypothetical protein